MTSGRRLTTLATAALLALGVGACGGSDKGDGVSGSIRIDGSSTVGPLTKAVAEEFVRVNPGVDITVGESGTGGGFEKLCAGETAINDASREVEEDEVKACRKKGIEIEEIQVANDALSIALNTENPVDCLTTAQLQRIWGPKDAVSEWTQLDDLDAGFDAELVRFGPGTDSGTFDYFTEAVNGEEGVLTKDFNNVGEDDNQTVTGVQGTLGGIGYIGFSFLQANEGRIKAAEIDNGDGCVPPSVETVQDGTYLPLSRGLFIYPSAKALKKEATKAFVDFYIENVNFIAPSIGFIGLTSEQLTEAQARVAALVGEKGAGKPS